MRGKYAGHRKWDIMFWKNNYFVVVMGGGGAKVVEDVFWAQNW